MIGLLRKLRICKHENVNVYEYVRNDGGLDDLIACDNYTRRRDIKSSFTGMRFCLQCGATQRFQLRDPLNGEPWLAPWIWRNK